MSVLSKKDTRTVLASLEQQGARLVKTTKGVRVLFPNGKSTSIHWSTSDHRATLNVRAEVLRNGLTWPFDSNERTGKMPVNKKGVHLSAEQRDRLAAAIGSYDGKDIAVSKLVAQTGLGIQAVRRGLHISGYSTGHGTRGLWVKMPTEAERAEEARLQAELEENLGFHYAEPYTEIELAQQARDARLAAVDRELREAEAERQAGYARAAEHARMEETRRLDSAEVFARQDAPEYHDQLQFIDDRDSWTIPVPAKLIEKAKAMGLEIEVRVWKP